MTAQEPPPRRLEDYPFRIRENVRFRDLDSFGHVNNGVVATYFETARTNLFYDPRYGVAPPVDRGFFLAHIAIDYRAEISFPGKVDLGLGLLKFGTTSFTLAEALFRDDGVLAATARAVLVSIDLRTRRPIPPAAETVAGLSAFAFV